MYLDYFGLDRDPFTISPDPAFLYPSPQHRQALAHLKYGLDREGGFILLTGEVGTGKTTLTRLLLEQLPGNVRVAYILNAKLSTRDVLASICTELQLEFDPKDSIKSFTDVINRDLLVAHAQGKKTLLVIEESQNLDPDVLEMLRLLTNLETNTTKLLHILLVGQPELIDLIARNELRQLNQRVVSRFHIEPLNLAETSNYINHRMRRAGSSRQYFDAATVKTLHKLSGGIPRMLNLLAERSLLGAYATSAKALTPAIVKSASEEVFGQANEQMPKKASAGTPWLKTAIAASFLGVIGYLAYEFWPTEEAPTPIEISSNSAAVTDELQGVTANQTVLPQTDTEEVAQIEESPMQMGPHVEVEELSAEQAAAMVDIPGKNGSTPGKNGSTPGKNAYEQLLSTWGMDAELTNQGQLCSMANDLRLSCQGDSGLVLQDLYEINRPGLVTVSEGLEAQSVYLAVSLAEGRIEIANSSSVQHLDLEEFLQRWKGDYLYLWRTPASYDGLIYPGARNPQMVSWVQRQLQQVFSSYEYVIAGGFYSQSISDAVAEFQRLQGIRADGLLGPRTIMRLMEQTEPLPRLIVDDASPQASLVQN